MNFLNEAAPAFFFYLFAAVIIGGALCVVLLKDIVHCAVCMAFTFFGVAAVYLLLHAEFIAIIQVLVYIGAITVLILFAIMLSKKDAGAEIKHTNSQSLSAAVLIAAFTYIVVKEIITVWPNVVAPEVPVIGSPAAIGMLLMRPYVLPFEAASILLLAAMVGAIVIARRDD